MSPLLAAGVVLDPSAHGIGGQRDLPISLNLAVTGAVLALVASFAVLALAWRTPRYDVGSRDRTAPAWLAGWIDSTPWRVLLRGVGMLVAVYFVVTAVLGVDEVTNPFFGIVFVLLWVGLVPASFLFGRAYAAINPLRTIVAGLTRVTGGDPRVGLYAYSERVGLWPAAVGLYAFVWLELVYPHSTELAPVRLWFAVYAAVIVVGGLLWGEEFCARADPFEVYSGMVAKLSFWGRDDDGALVLRSPLANLSTVVRQPGLVGVVAVLFGSTGFDSFKDSSRWIGFVQSSSIDGRVLANLGLIAFVLAAGLVFSVACMLTGVDSPAAGLRGAVRTRAWLPAAFAHTIVPIVLGYIVAHYLSFFVQTGSHTMALLSDPLSNGANLFGTAHWDGILWFAYHPTLLATVKVLAVVVGHVVAAVAAHDRALHLLPARHRITGQVPLLVAMVAFTGVGLYLLFAA